LLIVSNDMEYFGLKRVAAYEIQDSIEG
jgi:hypothetical protein